MDTIEANNTFDNLLRQAETLFNVPINGGSVGPIFGFERAEKAIDNVIAARDSQGEILTEAQQHGLEALQQEMVLRAYLDSNCTSTQFRERMEQKAARFAQKYEINEESAERLEKAAGLRSYERRPKSEQLEIDAVNQVVGIIAGQPKTLLELRIAIQVLQQVANGKFSREPFLDLEMPPESARNRMARRHYAALGAIELKAIMDNGRVPADFTNVQTIHLQGAKGADWKPGAS